MPAIFQPGIVVAAQEKFADASISDPSLLEGLCVAGGADRGIPGAGD